MGYLDDKLPSTPYPTHTQKVGASRVDPDEKEQHRGFRLEALEDEVRAETEHDALMAKAKDKLAQFTVEPVEKINTRPQ